MSAFTLEQLPGEPILVATISSEWRFETDLDPYNQQLAALLDSLTEPAYYVADVRQVTVGLNDLMADTSTAADGVSAYLRHPNIRGIIAVTTNKALVQALRGLNSQAFGFVSVSVYPTLEHALAAVRSEIHANGASAKP